MARERIMIVEDDAIIAMRLQDTLESWGYPTAITANGERAVEWVNEFSPDLVLMDIRLDGRLDGIQAAEQIRTILGPPTIFLTAYSDEELIERAKLTEPYGYLVKPVHERELRSTIEMALFKHQMDRKLQQSERQLRAIFEQAGVGVSLVDSTSGRILQVNQKFCQIIGYTSEEVVEGQLTHQQFSFSEDQPEEELLFKKLWQGDVHEFSVEKRYRRKDGSEVWVNQTVSAIWEAGEAPTHHIVVLEDITARKQAETNLNRNLQRIASLHEIDTVIRSNLDLKVTLGIILEHVVFQLDVGAADVLLADGNSPYLQHAAQKGFVSWVGDSLQTRMGEGLAGRAALKRQRIKGNRQDFDNEPSARARIFHDEHFQNSYSVPLLSKGKVVGVLEVFSRAEIEPDIEWLNFLGNLAGQVALAIEDLSLLANLHSTNAELALAYDETIEGWSRAMDLRDRETEGHTRRVTEMTVTLAKAMGLPEEAILQYRRGALLHDIGKIGVPDSILHKPGPLTEEEWVIMRRHPQQAYELLAPISYLQLALDIPYCHHERWDGSGYPRGLNGDQIPLAARLFAVVDVFDALISDRPYRKAWTKDQALEYILQQSGIQFDPDVIDIFIKHFGDLPA